MNTVEVTSKSDVHRSPRALSAELAACYPPRVRLLALCCLALLCAGCSQPSRFEAPGGERAALDAGAFLPLRTSGSAILDASGRQVLLRGLQHHALQDVRYQGRELEPGDYATIASWGFTTLRLAISWSRVEPVRGTYDAGYLEELRAALDLAHAAGLSVILEWHQDLWGKCSQAPDSGLSYGANGAPDWTCPADYAPDLFGYNRLFDRLWANEDDLFDAWLAAWGAVLAQLGEHPALAGLDVLNEPLGTGSTPDFERKVLFPAYRKAVPALRARGANRLLFLDAPGLRNEALQIAAEPLTELGPDLVYAPHLYSGWISLYLFGLPASPDTKRKDFTNALSEAATLGLPLWNGEWGVNLRLPSGLRDLEYHLSLEDEARIGSSYWAFSRAVASQEKDSLAGSQTLLDPQRQPRLDVVERLSRPYPVQTPGRLTALRFDFAAHRLELTAEIDASLGAPLVLYAPARHLGERACLTVSGPGGWRWDELAAGERLLLAFDASGSWTVALAPCPTKG